MEYLFDLPFIRCKPKCFKDMDKKYVMDGYNEDLKICFEFNGEQHYKFIKYFHKNKLDFYWQMIRDYEKIQLCYKNKIKLIIIPHYIKKDQILDYIKKECYKLNITFTDKPNIPVSDLNIYNNEINSKN